MRSEKDAKYIYWLSQKEEAVLGRDLETQGSKLKCAKGLPAHRWMF